MTFLEAKLAIVGDFTEEQKINLHKLFISKLKLIAETLDGESIELEAIDFDFVFTEVD